MKVLVTGASGFVGRHLCQYLKNQGDFVIAQSRGGNFDPVASADEQCVCLLENIDEIRQILRKYQPDAVVHLAAASSVAYSWRHPHDTFLNNAQIFLNTVEAHRLETPSSRFLSVGSSEQYGIVSPDSVPLHETSACNPVSPYAVARVAQEQMSLVYVSGFKLDIVCTRSFNHIGPGQNSKFVIASFIKQAIEIKKRNRSNFECGNLRIIRDFVDIRDVVRAYRFLLEKGVSGEVYNVCSGRGVSLQYALDAVKKIYSIDVEAVILKDNIRPIDNPIIIGSNQKIADIGFCFSHSFESALENAARYSVNTDYDDICVK